MASAKNKKSVILFFAAIAILSICIASGLFKGIPLAYAQGEEQGKAWYLSDPWISITFPIIAALIFLMLETYLGLVRPMGKIEERTDTILNEVRDQTSKLIDSLTDSLMRVTDPHFIEAFTKGETPLTPDQKGRRDELIDKGRKNGLLIDEAKELRDLLEQGARDLSAGSLSAYAGFLLLIGMLTSTLTKDYSEGNKMDNEEAIKHRKQVVVN